jgi:hypothetical protein
MKKFAYSLLIAGVMALSLAIISTTAYANPALVPLPIQTVDYELLEIAELISITEEVIGRQLVTTVVYRLEDGGIITDVTKTDMINTLLRTDGSATTTRTRTLPSDWGSITLTASFRWWRGDNVLGPIHFRFVEATAVSASRNLSSMAEVTTWVVDRTRGAQSVGTASAWVEFRMHNRQNPFQHQSGTFRITSNDDGRISTN